MALDNPIIAIALLFIVVFALFFVLIYGILNVMEHRNARRNSMPKGTEPIAPPTMSSSQPVAPASGSKFCLKCGTKIPRIAEFCPECGSRQIPA
jgi:zinc ribbon protein